MYRYALNDLLEWTRRASRKPLVIRGARQVGKSHLVRMLAGEAFDSLLEINLETDLAAPSLFASRDPRKTVELLEIRYGVVVRPGSTLLFLDEIQAAPELLACLREFFEQMPELHVVAAGSLLEFTLAHHSFSMPVGRIEFMHLGPMVFEEFLLALGKDGLRDYLIRFAPRDGLPAAIHEELLRHLRTFLVVGGMPASVLAFAESGRVRECAAVQQSILSTYRDDFAKYGRKVDQRRLERVFQKIPRLLGGKFMYSHVDREDLSRELGRALELLCRARVAHRVRHTHANGIPLGAEADDRKFKVLFMDVGMLCRSLGLTLVDVESADELLLVKSGAVCEQFVGQHLVQGGEWFEEPELFCWMREKPQSNAEVDYLIAIGETVVPIEVKAGATGRLKSLHVFLREKNRSFGVRFNADTPSLLDARTSLADGDQRAFRLLSLPLYLVGQTRRLCRESGAGTKTNGFEQ